MSSLSHFFSSLSGALVPLLPLFLPQPLCFDQCQDLLLACQMSSGRIFRQDVLHGIDLAIVLHKTRLSPRIKASMVSVASVKNLAFIEDNRL